MKLSWKKTRDQNQWSAKCAYGIYEIIVSEFGPLGPQAHVCFYKNGRKDNVGSAANIRTHGGGDPKKLLSRAKATADQHYNEQIAKPTAVTELAAYGL